MGNRITNKQITDLFIEKFEKNIPFTPSDKRMMGIKLAQLKKNYKKMIDDGLIISDQSIEELIIDAIEYHAMIGKTFRSIASLGFGDVNEPINYWKKRRKLMEQKASEEETIHNQSDEKPVEKVMEVDYDKIIKQKQPKWMGNGDW